MKNLRLYMIVFCVLVSLPLAFVAWRAYGSLDRETQAQVRYFAERLLDEIEADLTDLVRKEESRVVDEYRHTMAKEDGDVRSPLAQLPHETFILGYFQNNPDGTFQTPLVENQDHLSGDLAGRVRELQAINTIFNQRKFVARPPVATPPESRKPSVVAKKEQLSFAGRYLKSSEKKKSKSVLGQEDTRVEEITPGQAMNLVQKEPERSAKTRKIGDAATSSVDRIPTADDDALAPSMEQHREAGQVVEKSAGDRFQAEVAPLQAISIDTGRVFIFRRIAINGQIYRQGFVLQLQPFLDHLLAVYYDPQPIARYTRLTLKAAGLKVTGDLTAANTGNATGDGVAGRAYPAPFGFLTAEIHAMALPPSPARQTLTWALAILGIVMVAGLVTIYHSARSVLDLSERRSQFVSAVTHELKTPLTNIRMYIEMLDQGIAATPEREQEYFGILASENARLSGLINNVLELSRLEKQTRRFDLKDGDLTDVLADVQSAMAENLAREGFDLKIETRQLPVFAYDRAVLVQVIVNLMENSIKFGRHLPEKRITIAADAVDGWVELKVSDTGPGIPKRALKKVFDDFYRVDGELARIAGGTGIGLALVKKLILSVGGQVWAENNAGPGCTIRLRLPPKKV